MSRLLSAALRAQLNASQSNDALLTLVKINHPSLGSPFYLVNDAVNHTSSGITYTAFSFRIGLPNDDDSTIKQVQLDIDNTTLEFITAIRSITTPMTVDVSYILASIPDQVQFSLTGLTARSVAYDIKNLKFILTVDDIMNTPLTSEQYSPALYRGLF